MGCVLLCRWVRIKKGLIGEGSVNLCDWFCVGIEEVKVKLLVWLYVFVRGRRGGLLEWKESTSSFL